MKIKIKTQQLKLKLKVKIPDEDSWVIRQLEIQRITYKLIREEVKIDKDLIFNY
jgi:hypothetical protein